MSNLSATAKVIIRNIIILGAVEVVLGLILILFAAFFSTSLIPGHIIGIIVGSGASVFRLIHLEKSINKSLAMQDKTASVRYFRLRYFLRALMTVAILIVSFLLHPYFVNIVSVLIGLSNMMIGAYIFKLFNKEEPKVE
ncbi:MAG: hypothetical protein FWE24_04065 [Defluviitaleaceae bacterium]|nr:hypothetical protein [Defluviitaleaceae bacterium]